MENRCESEEKSVEFFTETRFMSAKATYMSVDIIDTNNAANMAWKNDVIDLG